MSYRVIAGSAKGLRLTPVPGEGTRPIMDRAKEALFNIIGVEIYDIAIIDLFAGTGAIGIEALSRGADHAVFVDSHRAAVETIRQNLKATRLQDRAQVVYDSAFDVIKRGPREVFDLIYVAPPQYKGMWKETLLALEANPKWLPDGTQVIVQIDPKEKEPITLKRLVATDERRYGNTLLWFFVAEVNSEDASENG